MAKVVSADLTNFTLTLEDGSEHELFHHEYWMLCPIRTSWYPTDGKVGPLEFGTLLHNAKLSCGLVLAHEDLLTGIQPRSLKSENALKAENLLEELRKEYYPSLPSRLRCHYLNYDKKTAEERASLWKWTNRSLENCYLVLSGGLYHYADISIFEKLTGEPDNIDLAHTYWHTFNPITPEEYSRLEVLANSCLYFPNWEKFSELDFDSLKRWNESNSQNK